MTVSNEVRIPLIFNPEDGEDPIHHVFMRDPLRTPCGHVFDKVSILAWLQKAEEPTCPFDRKPIKKAELILDTELQQQILTYLADHPEEDDSEEYERLAEQYKPRGLLRNFNAFCERLAQHNWRATLYRTHQVAIICLVISASTFIVTTFLSDGSSDSPQWQSFKNGAFYLMGGSGVVTAITTVEALVHRRNRQQDRQE